MPRLVDCAFMRDEDEESRGLGVPKPLLQMCWRVEKLNPRPDDEGEVGYVYMHSSVKELVLDNRRVLCRVSRYDDVESGDGGVEHDDDANDRHVLSVLCIQPLSNDPEEEEEEAEQAEEEEDGGNDEYDDKYDHEYNDDDDDGDDDDMMMMPRTATGNHAMMQRQPTVTLEPP